FCQGKNSVHVTGLPGKVDRDDGSGAAVDFFPELRCIDVQGAGLDVDQHRLATAEKDHVDSGRKGHRRSDDLIAILYLKSQQGQMQPGSSRTERHSEGGPYIGTESFSKPLYLRASGDPAGAEGVDNFVDLLIIQ